MHGDQSFPLIARIGIFLLIVAVSVVRLYRGFRRDDLIVGRKGFSREFQYIKPSQQPVKFWSHVAVTLFLVSLAAVILFGLWPAYDWVQIVRPIHL